MADDTFAAAVALVLEHEGGYVDHPRDPGGATKYGITRRTLARWRAVRPWWKLPKSAVRRLSRREARDIYRARYWERCQCQELPTGLDYVVFDAAVNSGPQRAVKWLQQVVGTTVDGVIGARTLAAAARYPPDQAITHYMNRRVKFLRALSTFPTFGRGWLGRTASVHRRALQMAKATHSAAAAQRRHRPPGDNASPPPIPNPQYYKDHKDHKEIPMDIFSGYKTYAIAVIMMLIGILQLFGVPLPAFDQQSAGQLLSEGLAILFLRKGIKNSVENA